MTLNDGFDRTVSDWLDEQAGRGTPGYLDEILTRTTGTRQRPWWSSLERWLPMQTTLRLAPVPRVAWLLVVLGLIVALGAAVLVAGSRQRPAPPFGFARNGAILYGKGGDVLRLDPSTSATTSVVTGATVDGAPTFSRAGTRFSFIRVADGGQHTGTIFVANADGSDARAVLETGDVTWEDWSPDDSRLAIVSIVSGVGKIAVAKTDGCGSSILDVGMPVNDASWRTNDEILFRGQKTVDGVESAGLFTVKADGSDVRQVSPTLGDTIGRYQWPKVSGDGTKVAYHSFDQTDGLSPDGGKPNIEWDGKLLRIHVLDLTTGDDVVIPPATDPTNATVPVDQLNAVFSPDGTMLAFVGSDRLLVAPVDGSKAGRPIGPSAGSYDFSPDGTAVIATYPNDGVVRVLPLDGSAGFTVPLSGTDLPSWQRMAP